MCFEVNGQHYQSYLERLKTFRTNWIRTQSPESLASAGFFRACEGVDDVQCYSCGIRIYEWESADDPLTEHLRWSQSCKFANLMNEFKIAKGLLDEVFNTLNGFELAANLNGIDYLLKLLENKLQSNEHTQRGEDVAGNTDSGRNVQLGINTLLSHISRHCFK